MPNQPQDSNNLYGPFSSVLTDPLKGQQQATPQLSYAPTRTAALAMFANSFIQGAAKGERRKYEQSEQHKMEEEKNFDSVYAHIAASPTISKEGKEAAEKAYLTAKYSQVQEGIKGASKDHKDNPLLNLAQSITGAVLGPSENKKHKDLGTDVNTLLSIANDPKFKIDPSQLGAISGPQSGGQQPQTGQQQPAPAGSASTEKSQGLTVGTTGQQVPPQQRTPPPGTPAAAQAPNVDPSKWGTKEEMLADPDIRARMRVLDQQGIPIESTEIGRILASKPNSGTAPAAKGVTVAIADKDGKLTYRNALRTSDGSLVDPQTKQPIQGAFEPTTGVAAENRAVNPKPSSAAEKRAQLVKDTAEAYNLSDTDAEKRVAKTEAEGFQQKNTPKSTDEDKLTKNLLDSGKFADPAQAKQEAAKMLVDLESATIKAKSRAAAGGDGGGPSLSAGELQALVRGSMLGLVTPQFGRGANDPNRLAYLKAYADTISGSPEDAAATKLDAKALGQTLSKLEVTTGQVAGFEKAANKALDNALAASDKVPRDSSSMVNGWDQWLTKHTVDDPALQQLFVYTETAANEYARVIGSLTGASTNAARDQANSFIRAQLADKSYKAAAEAMKTDMKNRTEALGDQITQTKQSIRALGPAGTGTAPATPQTVKANGLTIHYKGDNGEDKSVTAKDQAQFDLLKQKLAAAGHAVQ